MDLQAPNTDRLELGPCTIHLDLREVHWTGEIRRLSAIEIALLRYLLERAPQPVSRDELLENVWEYREGIVTRAVDSAVFRLRSKIEVNPKEPLHLLTVFGAGYRLRLPEPAEVPEVPEGPLPEVPDVAEEPPSEAPVRSWRAAAVLLAATGLLAVAMGAQYGAEPTAAPTLTKISSTQEREIQPTFLGSDSVIFSRYHATTTQHDLFVMSLEDGSERQLSDTPEDEGLTRVSPDQRSLLVLSSSSTADDTRLSVLDLESDSQVVVAENVVAADWHGTDEIVAARRDARGHYVLEAFPWPAGVSPRQIGEREALPLMVDVHPTRSVMAIADENGLWVLPLDGGKSTLVDERRSGVREAAWTVDGHHLLALTQWSGRTAIWKFDWKGGAGVNPRLLHQGTQPLSGLTAASDGQVAFSIPEQTNEIRGVASDGSSRRIGTHQAVECVALSASGQHMAWLNWDPGVGEDTLVIQDLESGDLRYRQADDCPAFSADGTRIAYRERVEDEVGLRIVELNGTGTDFAPLDFAGAPSWSPGGHQVASASQRGIAVLEIASGETKRVTMGAFKHPSWSPDGRWIAASGVVDGQSGTFVYDVIEGTTRRISPQRSYRAAPSWLDDSGSLWVLVDERSDPTMLRMNLDGDVAERVRLLRDRRPGFWGIFDALPDPAGGWLVVQRQYAADIYVLSAG